MNCSDELNLQNTAGENTNVRFQMAIYSIGAGLYAELTTLLPVTHGLVDTWMLIVKAVYKL